MLGIVNTYLIDITAYIGYFQQHSLVTMVGVDGNMEDNYMGESSIPANDESIILYFKKPQHHTP